MADRLYNSQVEKENLEVHVDMERQRYAILAEKVETLDERLDTAIFELSEFRREHNRNLEKLREDVASQSQETNKLLLTAILGLFSVIVTLAIAFL